MDIFTSTATIVNPQLNQSINHLLYSFLEVAVIALVAGTTWAVKLWINSMKSGWKQTIAKRLVKYAQQKFDDNGDKAKYVAEKIHEHFPRLETEEVEHLLEEAVSDLKSPTLLTSPPVNKS